MTSDLQLFSRSEKLHQHSALCLMVDKAETVCTPLSQPVVPVFMYTASISAWHQGTEINSERQQLEMLANTETPALKKDLSLCFNSTVTHRSCGSLHRSIVTALIYVYIYWSRQSGNILVSLQTFRCNFCCVVLHLLPSYRINIFRCKCVRTADCTD